MGLLLDFANNNDVVGILLAQDNNTGGGDDSIYPHGWYGTAVRFGAYKNWVADVATPLGNSLPSSDGTVYLPLSARTNASAATESISAATGVVTLTYNAAANTATGYYNGTPVGSYSLAGWGFNPPLTLAVYGDSELESVVVPAGTVTASNFYVGPLTVGTPQLSITPAASNVLLTWPANFIGFTLQSTTNLIPPVLWTTNSPPPVVVNGHNTVTNPIAGTQRFFRLSQ